MFQIRLLQQRLFRGLSGLHDAGRPDQGDGGEVCQQDQQLRLVESKLLQDLTHYMFIMDSFFLSHHHFHIFTSNDNLTCCLLRRDIDVSLTGTSFMTFRALLRQIG